MAPEEGHARPRARALTLLLPFALLVVLGAALIVGDPAGRWLANDAPPAEEIAFDRVELQPGTFLLHVRNVAGAPVTIAQVMVDDAFWEFTAEPSAELGRFESATITIQYPWVEGEPHVIGLLTNSGLVWSHEVAVAIETPTPSASNLRDYAVIGLLVGLLPVAAGMAFFPAMRDAPARWTNALLALTLGLLTFLAVDTIGEGIELAGDVPGSYHGLSVFFGAAIAALIAVLVLERALKGRTSGPAILAILIAVGIGLHNLGEGLLIGSAFAIGSLALGSALIAGFAIHNVTEGPAVIAPLAKAHGRLPVGRFLMLAGIAGLPTVLGAWIGAFASYSILPVVFFGLGAGAIVVVLVQVGGAMKREGPLVTPLHMIAFIVGYAVMVATSLLTV